MTIEEVNAKLYTMIVNAGALDLYEKNKGRSIEELLNEIEKLLMRAANR